MSEVTELHERIADLTQTISDLRARMAIIEATNARIEKANRVASKLLTKDALTEAQDRADAIAHLYQGAMMMLSTVEMVIHTLWRTPVEQRPIELTEATVKMLRLMGHGPEYFLARDQYTLEAWIRFLARVTEADMPHQSQPLAWEAA